MTYQPRSAHKMKAQYVVQARGTEALTDDQLRAVPSLFATEAHESRSERFVPIPTIDVLNGLRKEGFEPFFAAQARTRVEGKEDFTKHMVRLRHRGMVNDKGEVFEVMLVNANDGTAAYNLLPGFFRFCCLNGLICGDFFDPLKVRHSGNAQEAVIEGTYRVLDSAEETIERVDVQRRIGLNRDESMAFAEAAHMLRFPDAYRDAEDPDFRPATVQPETLLRPRRYEDRPNDLWTTFNRVQENVIKGGQVGLGTRAGKTVRASTRAVTGIDQNVTLNRALWTLSDRMAQIKAAA